MAAQDVSRSTSATPPGAETPETPTTAQIAQIPARLTAVGARGAPFEPAIAADELPPGAMRRVTFGDLDVLLAHTSNGVVAVDDRCPHMSAPLSLGRLDGCLVDCPLHSG